MDLPKLIGSDRQIVWATRIRRDGLSDTDRDIAGTKRAMAQLIGEELERAEYVLAELEAFHAWLASQQHAAWFIDNRLSDEQWVVDNARDQAVLDFKGKYHLLRPFTGFWHAYSRTHPA
jgi:hypothetical protein